MKTGLGSILIMVALLEMSMSCWAGSTLECCRSARDFAAFTLSQAKWDQEAGGIVFDSTAPGKEIGGLRRATVESPEISVQRPFDQAIASWNAFTPSGSYLTIFLRVRVDGCWSGWYKMGLWNMDNHIWHKTTFPDQDDSFGYVAQETLKLKGRADAYRVRVQLESSDGRTFPVLRSLTVNLNDSHLEKEDIAPVKQAWGKELDVPELCQLSVPGGNVWCSPTSTAMVLRYWAKKLNRPEMVMGITEAAHNCYDEDYGGTGTWSFNTAYAGEFKGMFAYVTRFTSVSQIEAEIAKGMPVITALNPAILEGGNNPAAGHLMVIRGFTKDGDPIFNDPWAFLDRGEKLRKVFPRKNLENAWLGSSGSYGTVYIIYPEGYKPEIGY